MILKQKQQFQHLRPVIGQDDYEWLEVHKPDYLAAVEKELAGGKTPEEIYRHLLREIGDDRAALARRCRNAARFVAGQP
jgi:hypothetical protein